MTFEFGKKYIVDVTERGITPLMVFDEDRWYDKDHDDLDFLTDEEKIVVINDVLDKIRAEIEEYKSRQLALAIGVDDLEKGKQIALEYVLAILDKYKAASEKGMSDNFEAQTTNADCISRESLRRKLQEEHDFFVNSYGGFSNLPQNDKARVDEITNCIAMVVNEPPVQPQRKRGKWIEIEIDAGEFIYKCTECGMRVINPYKYCPNCGSYNGGEADGFNN